MSAEPHAAPLEVFIQVIGLVSNGCHSVQLNFISVIFQMRVMAGHIRIGSVENQLFELSSLHRFSIG